MSLRTTCTQVCSCSRAHEPRENLRTKCMFFYLTPLFPVLTMMIAIGQNNRPRMSVNHITVEFLRVENLEKMDCMPVNCKFCLFYYEKL